MLQTPDVSEISMYSKKMSRRDKTKILLPLFRKRGIVERK